MAGTLTISTLSDGTNSTSSTNCIQGSAKAWVNFNGASGAISASYNVSSITRTAAGRYTVTMTNALSDANYAVNITFSTDGTNAITTAPQLFVSNSAASNALTAPTTSSFVFSYTVARDATYTCVSVFR